MDNTEFNFKEWFSKYGLLALSLVLTSLIVLILPCFTVNGTSFSFVFKSGTELFWSIITVICSDIVNILLWISYTREGKILADNHPNKIEADKILGRCKVKDNKPKSPKRFETENTVKKVITISISTAFVGFAVPMLIIKYDYVTALAISLSFIISNAFGALDLFSYKHYYEHDYLKYAKQVELERGGQLND